MDGISIELLALDFFGLLNFHFWPLNWPIQLVQFPFNVLISHNVESGCASWVLGSTVFGGLGFCFFCDKMITRWWFQIFFYVHPYLEK